MLAFIKKIFNKERRTFAISPSPVRYVPKQVKNYRELKKCLNDPIALACYDKIIDLVCLNEFDVIGDERIKKHFEKLDRTIDLKTVYRLILDAYFLGFSLIKTKFEKIGDSYLPVRFEQVEHDRVQIDEEHKILDLHSKIEFDKFNHVFVTYNSDNFNRYGIAVLDTVSKFVNFKKEVIKFRLINSEAQSFPKQLVKYPQNVSKKDLQELVDAISQSVLNSAVAIPIDFDYQLILNQSNSTDDLFEKFLKYIDDQIETAMLGSSMLNEAGKVGSYSLVEIHQNNFLAKIENLKRMIERFFDEIIEKILLTNDFERSFFKLKNDLIEQEKIKNQIEIDLKLKELGVMWGNEELRKKYKLS